MKKSRYTIFFESKKNGWLLFNSVSRAFLKVKDEEAEAVKAILDDPEGYDYSATPLLYIQLRSLGFLVEEGRDDDFFNVQKMRNLTSLYGDRTLSLTIAITRACNFDCSYCFEGNRTGKPMSPEVEDALIRFIKSYGSDRLSIVWYGGEPLLAFDRILSIDRRIREMGKTYSASMITNGYLMTKERAAKLKELNISYLQITLDGGEATHNSRRYLKNGGPTYATILENIDNVMGSDFNGTLHIRVNVDRRNEKEFVDVYRYIAKKYPNDMGRRITVYPGFVKGDDHPDCSCFFDAVQQGEFLTRMYNEYGIAPLNIFPTRQSQQCVLTKHNAFVVGPDGELYKCWDDVGLKDKIVGDLGCQGNWNMPLIAEGMVACSYLDDPECKECFYFPICNGGCHRIRQKNLHNSVKHSPCTYFKGNIETLLEACYESAKKRAAAIQASNADTQTGPAVQQVTAAEAKTVSETGTQPEAGIQA